MAKRKLSNDQIADLLMDFDNGIIPVHLARKFNISPSTVSRLLKANNRTVYIRTAHHVLIDAKVKSRLRKVLSGYGISNPDFLISELDKAFLIALREEEEYPIIYVRSDDHA